MAERLSRKEKVMGPIPIVASKSRTFFLIKDTWRIEKAKRWFHPESNWGPKNQNLVCCPYTMEPFYNKAREE